MKRFLLFFASASLSFNAFAQSLSFPLSFKAETYTLIDFGNMETIKDTFSKNEIFLSETKIKVSSLNVNTTILEKDVSSVTKAKDENGNDVVGFVVKNNDAIFQERYILVHKKTAAKEKYILKMPLIDLKTGDIWAFGFYEN